MPNINLYVDDDTYTDFVRRANKDQSFKKELVEHIKEELKKSPGEKEVF